ncbi:MAG: response regulator transcription factor [Lachnospiraceae bacterium]|nr:response regulator transcription factor [Lachnospiraceae bacterium]
MRILIIEDEKEIADGLETVLTKEGFQVDSVQDGLAGLDYLLSDIYDLVLLDIMLPKLNGIDVLKNARREGIDIPIIMLTAKSQIEDKIRGLDYGADDYITKPFEVGELLARIRARTRMVKNSEDGEVTLGNLWLNPTTQKIGTKSNSIKLGNKEFQLMECLIRNGGQILSKDMLIMKVWGMEEGIEYNNLEVYISFLRKKLRFVKANVGIVTTKGVGYSLEEETENGEESQK